MQFGEQDRDEQEPKEKNPYLGEMCFRKRTEELATIFEIFF